MRYFILLCAVVVLGHPARAQTFAENTDGTDDAAFSVAVTEWCWVDVSDDAPAGGAVAPDGNDVGSINVPGGSLVAGTNEHLSAGCDVTATVLHAHAEASALDEISFDVNVNAPAAIEASANGFALGTSFTRTYGEDPGEAPAGSFREVVKDMQQSISARPVSYTLRFGRTAASGNHTFTVQYVATPQP
jgi:hypothetical protein